jgi:hypothetical protein
VVAVVAIPTLPIGIPVVVAAAIGVVMYFVQHRGRA